MAELTPHNAIQQALLHYILQYHPYMEEDKQDMIDFIVMRSENAYQAFLKASGEGKNAYECQQESDEVLFAGLHFSPITYLIEVGMDNFDFEMEKEEAVEVYRNPKVREIFRNYGEDIEGDDKEHLLIQELLPYLKHLKGKVND
jgi:hypothetical protein